MQRAPGITHALAERGLADRARHLSPEGPGQHVTSFRQAPIPADERTASAHADRTRQMHAATSHHALAGGMRYYLGVYSSSLNASLSLAS